MKSKKLQIKLYLKLEADRSLDDYINELIELLGLDKQKIFKIMNSSRNSSNINELGMFYDIWNTLDKDKTKKFCKDITGLPISKFSIINKT